MRVVVVVGLLVLGAVGNVGAHDNCPHANNVVSNCGFDVDDLTGWFAGEGTPYYDAANGATAPGSMCVSATDDGGTWLVHTGYCVTAFSGSTDYVGGFSLRQEAGGAMDHSYLELSQRPQTNCGGSPIAIELLTGVAVGGGWRDSKTLEITTSGTTGGLGLIAYFEASAPFVVCFDDAYMGIGLDPVLEIFADDLEGGTLDEWSGSAP